MGQEIEVKYLVSNVPDKAVRANQIEQYYTKIDELEEVRYRAVSNMKFYKTVKKGNGLLREEYEVEITKDTYEDSKINMVGNYISKQRRLIEHVISDKTYTIEVDVYQGNLEGLVVAEVEFESIAESKEFVENKPEWFVLDVTEKKEYKNKNLALRG